MWYNLGVEMHIPEGPGPIYERIIAEVRLRVAEGTLRPGERLAPTRVMARKLGVNPNTVARAYGTLERQGVLEARQGSGTYIASDPHAQTLAAARDEQLALVMRRALVEALSLGYGEQQVEAAWQAGYADWLADRDGEAVLRFHGSHDPALDLLWALASNARPGYHVRSSAVGSLWGLVALERGETQIAGTHLLDPDTGTYNVPWIRRLLAGRSVALLRLGDREQGLMFRGDEHAYASLADVAATGARFVNRQRGSGTRVLLDHHLRAEGIPTENIAGYDSEVTTHSQVAAAVASGAADVGLGLRSAARALGLNFVPMASEQYDLVTLAESLTLPSISAVLDALRSGEFRRALESTGGYDTTRTGDMQILQA